MPPYSDLLDFYKLQAECSESHVIHTSYVKDRSQSVQRVKVEQRWDNVKRIGHGAFGEVWLQKGEKGDERAVKQLSKYRMEDLGIDYERELDALAKFNTPRIRQEEVIVEFLGWFESDETLYLAMEYCPLGDLSKHISTGDINETGAKQITRDLLEALTIVHDEGFTHRDIKPQNIFVMRKSPHWWVKLADFGISKRIDSDHTALRTRVGTARYLAPEVEDEDLLDCDYTQAVDIWSLGCVVYHVLVQEPPFLTTFSKKKPFPEGLLEAQSLSRALLFIRKLLVPDPAQRVTARDALSSEWLLDANGSLDANFGLSRTSAEIQDRLSLQNLERRQPMQTALSDAFTRFKIADDSTRIGPKAPMLEHSTSDRIVRKIDHSPSNDPTVVDPRIPTLKHSTPGTILPMFSSFAFAQPEVSRDLKASTKAKRARVLFGYEPVESNELLMVEGDTITEIDMLDEDWWAGKLRGVLGMFPSNYVKLIDEDEDQAPSEKRRSAVALRSCEPLEMYGLLLMKRDLITEIEMVDENWWRGKNPRGDRGLFRSNLVELITDAHQASMNVRTAKAQFDYEPGEDNELQIKKNDDINILEVPSEDWWYGQNPRGERGLFPSNYVRVEMIGGIDAKAGALGKGSGGG